MRRLPNNLGAEKDARIRESGNDRSAIRIRVQYKCDQHAVGKIAAEEKCCNRCADHPDEEIKCKPEGAPRAFETFADEPEKPEGQHNPKAERLRNKDVSDQPPDLAVANACRIEIERETEIGIQPHQRPNQRGEANHDPDQSRNAKKTKTAFEFIKPRHRWPNVAQQSLTSILSTLRPVATPWGAGLL